MISDLIVVVLNMIVAATEGHIITKNLMEAAAVDYGFESLPRRVKGA
jgi:hypothetical protein